MGTTLTRLLATEKAKVNSDNRTISVAVSSEAPVNRIFGREILSHKKGAVDLSFFGSGRAPLLLDHDPTNQVGVVESASLDEDGMLRAQCRFSKSTRASEVLADVEDDIRVNVSVGYNIEKWVELPSGDGYTITRWKPMEVSLVSVPADEKVGVGRSIETERTLEMDPVVVPAAPAPVPPAAVVAPPPNTDAIVAAAEARGEAIIQMRELAARHNMLPKLNTFLSPNVRSLPADSILAQCRGFIIDNLPDGKPLETPEVGLTPKQVKRFSVMNLVRAMDKNASDSARKAAGFEFEACQAADDIAQSQGVRAAQGVRLPPEVMLNWDMSKRTLNTSDDASLIPTEHLAGSFIDLLRQKTVVMQAGVRVMTGLSGNIEIPRMATGGVATWVSAEHGDATATEPTFNEIALSPKDLAAYVDLSRRFMQQSSPDGEALVRSDILAMFAKAINLAVLEGTAASGQPRGIVNVVGVNKPTDFVGATPTWAETLAMVSAVEEDEALDGSLSFIGRTSMRAALRQVLKTAAISGYIIGDDNTLNGYPYRATNNMSAGGRLYFGNWADVIVGFWSGLDLRTDTAALALKGGTRLIAFQTLDIAVRHPESFAWNESA